MFRNNTNKNYTNKINYKYKIQQQQQQNTTTKNV